MHQDTRAIREYLAWYRDVYGDLAYVLPESSLTITEPMSERPVQPGLFEEPTESTDPYACVEARIPTDSPLRQMRTLEEVEAYVRQTILIPIDKTRKNPVFSDGNPEADLMVIGEAPGAEEDRQGKPFVGRAGQLLNKMLQAIGFAREDVYITNILKSRPPNNRDPLPEEIQAHLPILYKQIALVKPLVILCVGRIAGNALLGKNTTLKVLRSRVHTFCGLPVVVTYHPAALLRNPQWKRAAWEDLQLLRKIYDERVAQKSS